MHTRQGEVLAASFYAAQLFGFEKDYEADLRQLKDSTAPKDGWS
jgi:hypothetical protein